MTTFDEYFLREMQDPAFARLYAESRVALDAELIRNLLAECAKLRRKVARLERKLGRLDSQR